MTKRTKKILFAVIVVIALCALWLLPANKPDSSTASTRLVAVEKGTIEEVVTAQGKLEPKEYVDVGTQVSGQVKTLHVEIGDDVKQGDLLAEIDPRIYESRVEANTAQLKSLKAQLAEQQANFELARQQHARNEVLIKTTAISKDAFDISAATLKTAAARVGTQKAQIEQMESTLAGDQTNLSYTKIYAPMTGTVVTLPAREGQTVNASQTAPTLMQLANLDVMTIRAQVAEADVMKLKAGMEVRFTTRGAMEKRWSATVRQVLPSPEIINDVVLYNVLIDVDNRERQLMNGMSTQIFFALGRAENVLVLPIEALGKRSAKEDSEAGPAYRVTLKNGQEKLIHVGLMDRTSAEIRDGLTEGDMVAVVVSKPQGNNQQRQGGGTSRGPRL